MKVTYNWLKDFVEIKITPHRLAEKLTMAGLEVTSLEEQDGDFVFGIEVTSNRPDWLSVIGVAREVAAITNSKFKIQNSKFKIKNLKKENNKLKIEIQDKKDCPLYTAKIIRDVKVGPSPDWLKRRLELIGCRSVNNIVDITNYVLFTWGEPLHAFDLDKLGQQAIFVRRAKNNEKITTIDGQQRILNPEILVIADKLKPVALAGIMGGRETEVTESTKNILLEAAVFNPIIIRHSRQALGLTSESAYRFERGVDLSLAEKASWRALELIERFAGGRCVLTKSVGLVKSKTKNINLDLARVHKILGIDIASGKIKKILNSLGLKIKINSGNNFTVRIPSYRPDLNLEIDLIEEIARIFGFDFIPKTLPAVKPQLTLYDTRDLVSLTKNILVGLGLNEVVTYSLIDKDILSSFGMAQVSQVIEILNPLSKEQEILRSTLLPSLSRCLAYNLNQKQEQINIFEIAKAFLDSSALPKEELVLGIALSGAKSFLLEQGQIKDEVGFLHLKGILEVLFERLGIKNYNFDITIDPGAISVYSNKEKIGKMIRLEKSILETLNIKNKDVFLTEVSLDKVFSHARLKKNFVSPPKYPGINRDISFIIKEDISVKEILEAAREKGRPLLTDINITDYYKGKQIPSGFRGLTISCLYRSDERTLSEPEINPVHALICGLLSEHFGAKIR